MVQNLTHLAAVVQILAGLGVVTVLLAFLKRDLE